MWTDIIVPVASVISIIAGLIIRLRSRPLTKSIRSRLKDDLEILKLLQDTHHNKYQIVSSQVDVLIDEVYKQPLIEKGGQQPLKREGFNKLRPSEWTLFILGIIAFVGFFIWSWQIWRDPFNWWVIGTGFGSFAGIYWIVLSYQNQKSEGDDVVYNRYAEQMLFKGLHEDAIKLCNKAIEYNPIYAEAYSTRGMCYRAMGAKAEAIADFERFISLSDNILAKESTKLLIRDLSM